MLAAWRGGGSWAAGSSCCALGSARPESHLRGATTSPASTLHVWLPLAEARVWDERCLLHLSPLWGCPWWPRAAAEAPARSVWVGPLPRAPGAKSQAELISLQLVTCTSVSPVLLEEGMSLSKLQLQPPALLQAHPQPGISLTARIYLGIVGSFCLHGEASGFPQALCRIKTFPWHGDKEEI